MTIDVAIIGGGLSGLAVADALQKMGRDWVLYEARERLGGRVLSRAGSDTGARYDLGPAWIWPHNARMLAAAERFGLQLFQQFADGNLVFEDETGLVRRDLTFSTMAGSLRIDGGVGALIDALAAQLPADRLRTGHTVTHIADDEAARHLDLDTADGPLRKQAQHIVLALPPRVIDATMSTTPALPETARSVLRHTPTWMAAHAKFVAVYETPFWRDQGLSGDAISHRGPMVEIHDASPMDGRSGALFGFVGVPAAHRDGQTEALSQAASEQFATLFGAEAATPADLYYEDWATARETATQLDFKAASQHPAYGMPAALKGLWQGRLHFAGTEVAETEGGYLEGALQAAETCVARLKTALE